MNRQNGFIVKSTREPLEDAIAMSKPGLLLRSESAERLLGGALADRFDFIRLWQADDPRALLADRGADVIAALTTELDAELLAYLPGLRLIAVPGAGYEHVDVAAARARGVTVANAGGAHSADVADHAVAMTLASIHRLPEMQAWVGEGDWQRLGAPARRYGLSAQRFGIVGLGHIGHAIAERLAVFGGEIAWWGPRAKPVAWPRKDSLHDLAAWSSVLIIATRGDAAGLIDANAIAAVGRDGLIVNIARGAVVDEEALIAGLQNGTLGRAALDVFVDEPADPERWRDVARVMLSPHVAGVSHGAFERLRAAAIRNLCSVLDGGGVVNEIVS